MLKFEVLARGVYRPEGLRIEYDPSWRMPITPDRQLWMDKLWEQKLALAHERSSLLFDSQLFRLVEARSIPGGPLLLRLGNTSYKEYVTTREPQFASHHSREELGNAIGVCSVVETSDGFMLLDKRQGVDVYEGRYHVIGGFFERELDGESGPDPFGAVTREIHEETGVRPEEIAYQCCLGAVYDLETPHGEICFYTQLEIPLSEVQQREPESDEIKSLEALKISSENLRNFIGEYHGRISSTGEPTMLMYGELKFGEIWYKEMVKHLM